MRPVLEDVEEVAVPGGAVVVEAGLALEGKIQAQVQARVRVQAQVQSLVGSVLAVRKRIPTLHPHTPNSSLEILEVPQEVQVIRNKTMEQALEQALEQPLEQPLESKLGTKISLI